MSLIDWVVLGGTLAFIVIYGVWKTRGSRNINDFLLADKSVKWWTVCLSIMATQASAITFLSTPGQAFADGMRFIQFYFGLPIAMVMIAAVAVPIYAKLNVYTAYEYLESRFDLKTRSLAAFLFLLQRGLATGITIFAPSIILSSLLGWNLSLTNIIIGGLVIIYTVSGGTKAVSITQKQQMAVMMGGMIIAGIVVILKLPEEITFVDSLHIAGNMGRLNLVDFSFDPNDRYNFWSGITASLFLFLSYFGTDQSQVARYLSGKSIKESRLGLLFNGLLKIPMQFIILFIGVLVFVFFQFYQPPIFFNKTALDRAKNTTYSQEITALEKRHEEVFLKKREEVQNLVASVKSDNNLEIKVIQDKLEVLTKEYKEIHNELTTVMGRAVPDAELKDTDYVFLTFIMNYMPIGLVGLLLAVILSAAMSSTASELNALASTTVVDIYKRSIYKTGSDRHYLNASRWLTLIWGIIAICFAFVVSLFENLIQLVNLLGSLFYGPILGIFVAGFFFRYIRSEAVFIAAILAEIVVWMCYFYTDIAFLWFNPIGCGFVLFFALLIQVIVSLKTSDRRQE